MEGQLLPRCTANVAHPDVEVLGKTLCQNGTMAPTLMDHNLVGHLIGAKGMSEILDRSVSGGRTFRQSFYNIQPSALLLVADIDPYRSNSTLRAAPSSQSVEDRSS